MIEAAILLLAGVAIATIVVAIGIGGGVLWTPLLILGFNLPPQEAISTSLMIQVAGLGSGTVAYARAGAVRWRLAGLFFAVALPGVLAASVFSVQLSQATTQMALGIMSMILAILFVSRGDAPLAGERLERSRVLGVLPIPGVFGFAMGLLSVGISEWLIPALRGRVGLSMREAVAVAIPMMFGLVLVAAISHAVVGHSIHWAYLAAGAAGTAVGGQLGPRLARRIDEGLLKNSFIYLMTLIGIHLIFQSI